MSYDSAFANVLLDPEAKPPKSVLAVGPVSAERRLSVHRNTFVSGAIDALAAAFPVVQLLVGEAFFRATARAYTLEHPPRSPLATDHPSGFPGFLDAFPPAREVRYLADSARVELARLDAYHAADEPAFDTGRLLDLANEPEMLWGVRARVRAGTACIRSAYAIHAIWWAHQPGSISADGIARLDPDGPEAVVVFRDGYDVCLELLPAGGSAFIEALQRGATLGMAYGSAVEAAEDVQPYPMIRLLTLGLLSDIILPHSDSTP
jgi:hypothetical protein